MGGKNALGFCKLSAEAPCAWGSPSCSPSCAEQLQLVGRCAAAVTWFGSNLRWPPQHAKIKLSHMFQCKLLCQKVTVQVVFERSCSPVEKNIFRYPRKREDRCSNTYFFFLFSWINNAKQRCLNIRGICSILSCVIKTHLGAKARKGSIQLRVPVLLIAPNKPKGKSCVPTAQLEVPLLGLRALRC